MNRNSGIITICKKCKYCEPLTRWSDPSSYCCKQSYRSRISYVSGLTLVDKEFCTNINTDGHCPNYDKK